MANDIIRIRRDNETNWNAEDPTLGLGEIGYNTTNKKLKVGDGTTPWTTLSYVTAGITDGSYGDIVVSSGGSTWSLSTALMSTINGKLNSGPIDCGTPASVTQVIKIRRGTSWTGVVLNAGEIGYDTALNEIRIGDGATVWSGLNPIGLPKISTFDLDDLGDVVITTPSTGDILTWNGTGWENTTPAPGPVNLEDLANVAISTPINTQILQYNGTNWENKGLSLTPTGTAGGDLSGTYPNPVLKTGTVTLNKLETRNRETLLGVGTGIGTTAPVAEITLGSGLSLSGNVLSSTGGISDGDKGDITVTGSGATWTIDSGVVGTSKLGGDITTAGKALLDDADAAAQRTTLGLGSISTQNSNSIAVTGGTLSGVTVTTGTYSSPANEALLIPVRKSTTGTISKGRPVYIVGAVGDNLTVELAQANTEATSAYTIGIAATDITTTSGFIMQAGRLVDVDNLPTSTFSNGDAIYLSESTAGGLRKTIPTQPNHGVFLGFVVKANNGSAGIMDVRIQNYQEMDELSDVLIASKAEKDVLSYDATAGVWKNRTLSGAGIAAAVHTHAISDITNLQTALDNKVDDSQFTAFGLDLVDSVDAAAARTTLGLGTTDTPQFAGITLSNGEFITNSVDGQLRLGTNGTSSSHFALTIDGVTWGSGVQLGTRRNSDGATTEAIWFTAPLLTGNGVTLSLGTSQWYTISQQQSGNQSCATIGLLSGTQNTDSSGALVICTNNVRGSVNRVPTTDHEDPTLYVYSRGNSSAADYVRINHDTTNGTIESGDGKLILKSATRVRVEGSAGGFDLPTGDGLNGQVLTTNGTGSVSWQTPSGGGGGVDEDFVIAMAIALG